MNDAMTKWSVTRSGAALVEPECIRHPIEWAVSDGAGRRTPMASCSAALDAACADPSLLVQVSETGSGRWHWVPLAIEPGDVTLHLDLWDGDVPLRVVSGAECEVLGW